MRRSGAKIMLQLIGLVRPLLHIMVGAIILGICGYLCAIFIPVFGIFGIVDALGIRTILSARTIAVCLILFAVFRGLLRYSEQAANHYIAFKLLALIRHKVFKALQKLAPAKLEGKDKGNLISVITSDIELLEVFYAHTISPIAIGFITSLLMIVFFGSYHLIIAIVVAVGYLIVGVFIPLWISALGKKDGMTYRNEFGELNSHFLASLRGLQECIQYGTGEKRMEQMCARTDKLEIIQKRLKSGEGKTKAATGIVIMMTGLFVLVISIMLADSGNLSFEGIIVCTVAAVSSFGPVVALGNLSNNLVHTLASGERVLSLLEEIPIVTEISGEKPAKPGSLECANVSFSYGDESILKNCSMMLRKNSITGLYGKSGSGKSTLLKLLMRFWEADKGEIKVSGRVINKINTVDLRNMEAYVTQETYLFHTTIRENISISRPKASLSEIQEAAKKASVHEYIKSLPNGYDTRVSELGESLSGGERQRIGLARAFLHDAKILLLDEPTSNLDSLNEGIILKSLKETCQEKTVVLVSHRKSTLHIADQIYRVETGRVS